MSDWSESPRFPLFSFFLSFFLTWNLSLFELYDLGRVFTSNFSLAKINCHRHFGKVFAFTHSNEKLKRKFVEESLLTYFVT